MLGLRWSDVDLKARTLTVSQSRITVDYKVYVEPPKTRNGQRTLPLDDALVAALTALRKRLARESEEAASAYEPPYPRWTGTPQATSTSSWTSWVLPCIPSGTPTSSPGC